MEMLLERPSRFYSEEEEEEEEEREVVERRPRQVSSAQWFSLFPDSLITVACLFLGWPRADDGMFRSKK